MNMLSFTKRYTTIASKLATVPGAIGEKPTKNNVAIDLLIFCIYKKFFIFYQVRNTAYKCEGSCQDHHIKNNIL